MKKFNPSWQFEGISLNTLVDMRQRNAKSKSHEMAVIFPNVATHSSLNDTLLCKQALFGRSKNIWLMSTLDTIESMSKDFLNNPYECMQTIDGPNKISHSGQTYWPVLKICDYNYRWFQEYTVCVLFEPPHDEALMDRDLGDMLTVLGIPLSTHARFESSQSGVSSAELNQGKTRHELKNLNHGLTINQHLQWQVI